MSFPDNCIPGTDIPYFPILADTRYRGVTAQQGCSTTTATDHSPIQRAARLEQLALDAGMEVERGYWNSEDGTTLKIESAGSGDAAVFLYEEDDDAGRSDPLFIGIEQAHFLVSQLTRIFNL